VEYQDDDTHDGRDRGGARSRVTQRDPTRSIHVAVSRWMSPFLGGGDILPWSVTQDDLDSRAHSWDIINAAWCLLAFACGVAMVAVGIPLQILFGPGVGNVIICTGLGATFFCIAGCANALRRRYWFVPQARRRVRTGAPHRDYEASWRRTMPRNNSVVFQAAVAILAVVIAASNL
jgi:hypothetical protein